MTPEPSTDNELLRTRRNQMFPKLTAAQIARLEHHGERRQMRAGEILYQPGDRPRNFFVVIAGDIELLSLAARRLRAVQYADSRGISPAR